MLILQVSHMPLNMTIMQLPEHAEKQVSANAEVRLPVVANRCSNTGDLYY
jgi:hypothetical protein